MVASDHVQVVGKRVVRRNKRRLNRRSNADSETAAGGAHHYVGLVRHKAVHLYADVASRKIIVIETMHGRAIGGQSQLIEGGRRNQISMTDGPGLRQVVQTALD